MCKLSNYVIANSCEVELFVECGGCNEGLWMTFFSCNFEDNSDELVKAVQLDDSKEENAIGLDDDFDLPIPEIGRLENKRIKRSTIKKRCVIRGRKVHNDDDQANNQRACVELIYISNDYFSQEENLPSEV